MRGVIDFKLITLFLR